MNDAVETLRLFNEKVDKLMSLRFTEALQRNEVKVERTYYPDRGWSAMRTGPGSEEIEAFVLTMRFFLQNNERISIANVANLYERLPVAEDLKEAIRKTRRQLNEFLGSSSEIVWKHETLTRQRILDIFLYGGLAHANRDKKRLYDDWRPIKAVRMARRGVYPYLQWRTPSNRLDASRQQASPP